MNDKMDRDALERFRKAEGGRGGAAEIKRPRPVAEPEPRTYEDWFLDKALAVRLWIALNPRVARNTAIGAVVGGLISFFLVSRLF